MYLSSKNLGAIVIRYQQMILMEHSQIALDITRNCRAAITMMQRNLVIACGDESLDALWLFASAAAIYFDSLLWILYRG